ncbi:uncharacterized protein A4U43_C04F20300 [Asparagus officinalis]|uniref:Uncharacterized protein n=2 Tax=Asparagus officinalis TaxID=4686 RepID=A0A5P1F462_ASPOF|nr:uncharacterized protein A4U43_C04F20300 [Asparagus officinalis]
MHIVTSGWFFIRSETTRGRCCLFRGRSISNPIIWTRFTISAGCFKDVGRYRRASEMYTRVLEIRPDHWRAQLNRVVCLLGSGKDQEAMKSLSEAFKMTNRIEVYDALRHLKMLKRRREEGGSVNWIVEDASKFKLVDEKTGERKLLIDALRIREIQKATKLGGCNVEVIKKEKEGIEVRTSERSIRKSELEFVLRRLLHFLPPETFQCAVRAIDEKFWAVLDVTGSGNIDYKMFFAIISPICYGSPEKRKRAAFDALLCRASNDGVKVHVYLRYLRVVYLPSLGFTELIGINGGGEDVNIPFREFIDWFDDPDQGFGVMSSLVKLEAGDRARRGKYSCGVCKYRVGGLMLKEISSHFCLCASCYSECRVPFAFQKEEYKFKEYIVE